MWRVGSLLQTAAAEGGTSTDDEDLEADLGNFEPQLADPVAEQNRLLNERPLYMDDTPVVGTKLINLTDLAVQESTPYSGAEPNGTSHGLQQVTFADPPTEVGNDSFSASVAIALAKEEEGAL